MKRLAWIVVTLAAACAPGKPQPPVIDSLTMPPTATIDPGTGRYLISGSLSYHDPDDLVVTVRLAVPSAGQTRDTAVGLAGGVIGLNVSIAGTAPKGPTEYDVTLIDESGLATTQQNSVTLQ